MHESNMLNSYNRLYNRLHRVYIHFPGCTTGCTAGCTTGCIVYTGFNYRSNAQSGTEAELTEAVTTVTYHHFTNIQQTLDRHSVSIHLQLSTQTNRRLKLYALQTVNNVVFQMKTMQFTTQQARSQGGLEGLDPQTFPIHRDATFYV